MGAERLAALFDRVRREGRAALLPYLTAGLPTPADSPGLFEALAGAGADGFEIGIPYTDPMMDGPVIQRGSDTAIAAGTTIDVSLTIISAVAEGTRLPVLAMTYANPVMRRGVDRFCADLVLAGADGLIVPDLPVEEADAVRIAAGRHGLGLVLFVAPTSDRDRIARVAAADPSFIYAVADMGVTGERTGDSGHIRDLAERVRSVTDIPMVFGVGISNAEQAAAAAAVADGVIVGSAFVRRVLEAAGPTEAAERLASLAAELRLAVASR